MGVTRISVIIPAYNEEKDIRTTIDHLNQANRYLEANNCPSAQIIVVDNMSTDRTAQIAKESGAVVVGEPIRNIARARNVGAKAAHGDVLIFVDADTIVPEMLLWRISQTMLNPACAGGAVDTYYRPARLAVRLYLGMWRVAGRLLGMAQGATQFCRRELYFLVGGYDERIFMGEDVDFYFRLRRAARKSGLRCCFIRDLRVLPSCRRFDQWPLWRTLLWTNPLVITYFQRHKAFWADWYETPPR